MRSRNLAPITTALACVVLALSWPNANAWTFADALKARREQRAAAADAVEAEAEADGGDSARGTLPLPADLDIRRDQGYGDDARQKLDVYIPRGAQAAPILLMVHGGGWMFGDKQAGNVVNGKVTRWAPRGYIVVSTNYRLARPPKVLEQAEDVARALAYTQAKAASWGGDPTRVVLMGHSAGAHLAALLAAAPQIATAQGARPWAGTISLDSAALDVIQIMEGQHPRFYDRVFGKERTFWEQVSPYQRLTAAPAAPMLLVCSSRRDDSCGRAKAFANRVESLGGRASVLPVDLNHGEINSKLGSESEYSRSVDSFLRSLKLP